MNRLVLDQGLAPRAAEILRHFGWDAIHVSEVGMSRADDLAILEAALSEHRICITLDHDFHGNLGLPGTLDRRLCYCASQAWKRTAKQI